MRLLGRCPNPTFMLPLQEQEETRAKYIHTNIQSYSKKVAVCKRSLQEQEETQASLTHGHTVRRQPFASQGGRLQKKLHLLRG